MGVVFVQQPHNDHLLGRSRILETPELSFFRFPIPPQSAAQHWLNMLTSSRTTLLDAEKSSNAKVKQNAAVDLRDEKVSHTTIVIHFPKESWIWNFRTSGGRRMGLSAIRQILILTLTHLPPSSALHISSRTHYIAWMNATQHWQWPDRYTCHSQLVIVTRPEQNTIVPV